MKKIHVTVAWYKDPLNEDEHHLCIKDPRIFLGSVHRYKEYGTFYYKNDFSDYSFDSLARAKQDVEEYLKIKG